MTQFIETLCIEDGRPKHLAYHLNRMIRTSQHFHGVRIPLHPLFEHIAVTKSCGRAKLRILYDTHILSIDETPYTPLYRHTVRLVTADSLLYNYKYADRTAIDQIWHKAGTDDIIIVQHDQITDSAIANLVFENSHGLFTPIHPLLAGTCRQRLLNQGIIREAVISRQTLSQYDRVYFINALCPLYSLPAFPVNMFLKDGQE
ncbi:MAG: aminotransferase class IV [Bacteroidales bacterium]|nr:aminotransferase class IV [Bacteroidales bacterium]